MEDLEKTYSRERQRLGDEQELRLPTTPLSLVAQGIQFPTWVSQCFAKLLVEGILQLPRIRVDEENVDTQSELEEKDGAKETTKSTASPTGSSSSSNEDPPAPARTIIRFDDNDPAQPNNWSQVRPDI